MRFSRLFLNRLQNLPEVHDTVVVIDTPVSYTHLTLPTNREV